MSSKKHIQFSLLALAIILGLRFLLILIEVQELKFLLYPVSVIVSWMCDMSFQWVPDLGYYHDESHILINKSCSGAFFMILLFGFLSAYHLVYHHGKRLYYLPLFLMLSYGMTILVNAQRISLFVWIDNNQIHLPGLFQQDFIHQFFGGLYYVLTLVTVLYLFIKPKQHEKIT